MASVATRAVSSAVSKSLNRVCDRFGFGLGGPLTPAARRSWELKVREATGGCRKAGQANVLRISSEPNPKVIVSRVAPGPPCGRGRAARAPFTRRRTAGAAGGSGGLRAGRFQADAPGHLRDPSWGRLRASLKHYRRSCARAGPHARFVRRCSLRGEMISRSVLHPSHEHLRTSLCGDVGFGNCEGAAPEAVLSGSDALTFAHATHEDRFVSRWNIMIVIPQWRARTAPFRPVWDGFGRQSLEILYSTALGRPAKAGLRLRLSRLVFCLLWAITGRLAPCYPPQPIHEKVIASD